MKRILLITHEATRTGAPYVVLHFARWLRDHHVPVEIDVLALAGGGLAEEFRNVADRYVELVVPQPKPKGLLLRVWEKALRVVGSAKVRSVQDHKDDLLKELCGRGYDVILANSIASIPVGVRLKELALGAPVLVAFIHELNMVIQRLLPDLGKHLSTVDAIWAASEMVRQQLVERWSVQSSRIEVQYECAIVTQRDALPTEQRRGDGFHVGGSGLASLRKGYDLFIQVARWVRFNHPSLDVRFTWVGRVAPHDRPLIEHDIEHAELQGVVDFIGELADPRPIYETFDVFLLTSREDPFPLVCIETGSMGKPIVCFDGATGTAEVLRNGGGKIVPYLDVVAMGQAVVDYARNPDRRQRDGQLNAVQFANFSVERQCSLIFARIRAALKRKILE